MQMQFHAGVSLSRCTAILEEQDWLYVFSSLLMLVAVYAQVTISSPMRMLLHETMLSVVLGACWTFDDTNNATQSVGCLCKHHSALSFSAGKNIASVICPFLQQQKSEMESLHSQKTLATTMEI